METICIRRWRISRSGELRKEGKDNYLVFTPEILNSINLFTDRACPPKKLFRRGLLRTYDEDTCKYIRFF